MLPSFVSSRSQHASDQATGARGRLQSWNHLPTDQVLQRGRAAATPDASGGIRALGNVMMVVMVVFSIVMAGAALHHEGRLQQQELRMQELR
jgi:hypothetical protein